MKSTSLGCVHEASLFTPLSSTTIGSPTRGYARLPDRNSNVSKLTPATHVSISQRARGRPLPTPHGGG